MPSTLRPIISLLIVALLVLLSGVPVLAGTGRDFSRCVHNCNEVRRACGERCESSCEEMFPNDRRQRSACIQACDDTCDAQSSECKKVCLAIKKEQCPTAP